jgi:hypothetical protein
LKQVKKISLIFLLIILVFSCQSDKNIEKEKLAKVYVDLLLADELYKDTDSLERKKTEVFEKYSVVKEDYDSSFVNLKYDSEEWDKFFDLATAYLDTLKAHQKLNEQKTE